MKRSLLIIAIFLLLGAVVNVAVAWGCAMLVGPTVVAEADVGSRATGQNSWEVATVSQSGVTMFFSTHGWRAEPGSFSAYGPSPRTLVPSWSDLETPTLEFRTVVASRPDELIIERRTIYCSGWPLRSLWCDSYGVGPAVRMFNTHRLLDSPTSEGGGGYIETSLNPWQNFFPRVLPLRSISPGFITNTIFYAALLWLLIPGPFALRRFLRVRRGLCPKCAYPMGESSVCTECGAERWPGTT